MNRMTDEGIALIKKFEGFRAERYSDPVGIPTIGYGHVIFPGETFVTVTEEQATAIMLRDIEAIRPRIAYYIERILNDNQYSAIMSLVFNLGVTPLTQTLGRKLNAGDIQGCADEFPRWVYAQKRLLPGLVKRRKAERDLFLKPIV